MRVRDIINVVHKNFKQILVTNLAITGGALLITLTVVFLLAFDISRRSETVQETKKELSFRFKSVEAAASLKKDASLADEEKIFIESILPIADQLINFPREISNLAKKHSIDSGFSFGREEASSVVKPGFISFNLTANANLSKWLEFVQALEESLYLISFDSFNLAAEGQIYRSVINGKVFTQ